MNPSPREITRPARMVDTMAKCIPDEKNNCLLQKNEPRIRLIRANFCVPGVMSRCSAGPLWDDQKRCKFAVKSTVRSSCMYFIESIGGHCDCVEAQRELRSTVKDTEKKS